MRTGAAVLAAVAALSACGDPGVDPADLPVARLAGEVCRVPLFAGAVAIGEGLVLTAAHVIAGAEGDIVVRLPFGAERQATPVAFDPERDLALLSVAGLTVPSVELAAATPGQETSIVTMDRDDTVVAVDAEVRREITATGDDIYGEGDVERRALELGADITPGMSGGGAFDSEGRLVGIVFAESRDRPVVYAVAASEIERFLADNDPGTPVEPGRCR